MSDWEAIMNLPIATITISLTVTCVTVACWMDYAFVCRTKYLNEHTRRTLRMFVVSMVTVVVSVVIGAVILIAWAIIPHSSALLTMLSTLRFMLLTVGIWLAWDRRRHPS